MRDILCGTVVSSRFDLQHVSFRGNPDARRQRPTTVSLPRVPERRNPDVVPQGTCAAQDFASWLLGAAGLNPLLYRPGSLDRRISAAFRALKVRTAPAARDLLARRPELLPVALSAVLIGVTDFFRDAHVFDDLRTAVVPELAKRNKPLRIWSAGCSSGSELYSVLMMMADAGLLSRCRALGTDCRDDALRSARAATYSMAELREVPQAMRDAYFEEAHGGWRIVARLRHAATWKPADLCTGVEVGPWDLILWRNMGIYLTDGAGEHVLSQLVRVLAPAGFLVVGKAERPSTREPLSAVCRCIYRKRG
jgi:chemotaxis methyl-accepting protein methylase